MRGEPPLVLDMACSVAARGKIIVAAAAGAEVRGVRRASGIARIFLPGEREASLLQSRYEHGIPIGAATWGELAALGVSLAVAVPSTQHVAGAA